MLDPYIGELRWANAGHPPAFLRGANGVATELRSTAVLLGALTPDEFTAAQEKIDLTPGDVMILYTDGAFESTDSRGRAFGLDTLRGLVRHQPPPANWPQFIAGLVEKHCGGRAGDDVLVAAVAFDGFRMQTAPAAEALAAGQHARSGWR
jgi:sigma-B regulation protein RsbU (phosphoserine phosphatase)